MYLVIKKIIKAVLPTKLYTKLLPYYHHALVLLAVVWYRNPSKKLKVVGVTGTKGKSSVTEMVNAVLEEAGYTTAVASTIRFKLGSESRPNLFKMTMPGRFFLQHFFRQAIQKKCDWVVLEMTSEGVKQFRHKGIALDALIFTNLSPEHIESHGSYENYVAAKLEIGKALARSSKRPRIMVANNDDEHGKDFLSLPVDTALPYTLADGEPYQTNHTGTTITFNETTLHSPFPGTFTAYNMLATATFADAIGIDTATTARALAALSVIPGRVQHIDGGQAYPVIVDYAHTEDSLRKLYEAFNGYTRVCVLGNTGGGRDTWKRPRMGACAEEYCHEVILTDEDPYDEDPQAIIDAMVAGMQKHPTIIRDRREAIAHALSSAENLPNAAVLISGKGTDPYIMRANGEKEAWSDAAVVKEELEKRSS